MIRLILLLIILNSQAFSNNDYGEIKLNKDTIKIGEHLKLILSFNTTEENILWPKFEEILPDGVEILKKSEIDTFLNNSQNKLYTYSQNILITVWDSGKFILPEVMINDKIRTRPITINVLSVNIEKESKEKDIKSILNEPFNIYDILPFVLIIIIFGFIFYFIRKLIYKKKKEKVIVKNEVPCDIEALKKLKSLKESSFLEKKMIKEYHSRISEIIRTYLEKRFRFLAMELTTDEIIENLDRKGIDRELLGQLSLILKRADLAKFAKSKPIDSESKESLLLSEDIIKRTNS